MKIKVVQMYTPSQKKEYRQLADLSKEINQKYCQMHNYEYHFIQFPQQVIIDQLGSFNWDNVIAYKQKFIEEQLTDCDYLVFIDADAAVSNPNYKIEDLIDSQHQLFLTRGDDRQHWVFRKMYDILHDYIFKDKRYGNQWVDQKLMRDFKFYPFFETFAQSWIQFNQGLYIIKNTEKMHYLFKQSWIIVKSYFLDCDWQSYSAPDGRSLRFVLLQKRYKGVYTYLFDQAQANVAQIGRTKYNVDKCFVMHNWGKATTMQQKIDLMKGLKTNKWWKNECSK